MRHLALLLILLLSLLPAQPATADAALPATARIGMYITSIDNIDMANGSFDAIFWLWYQTRDPGFSLEKDIELTNARSMEFSHTDESGPDGSGLRTGSAKVRATFSQDWDLSNYPLDQQTLGIRVESASRPTSELLLQADTVDSRIARISVNDYRSEELVSQQSTGLYDSHFGMPGFTPGTQLGYSRLDFRVRMTHVDNKTFFKMFFPTYAAFFVSLLCIILKPEDMEAKLGLFLASFFAIIGNQYILDDQIRGDAGMNLTDQIQFSTFLYAILAALLSTIGRHYSSGPGEQRFMRVERSTLAGFALIYIVYNIWCVLQALGPHATA